MATDPMQNQDVGMPRAGGEFGFIARIAERVTSHSGVRLGIGDDCALTEAQAGHITLTTTDLLVEGIHFELSYTDPAALGHKSLAVNLSDIAAMGGIPRYALLGLAIPPSVPLDFFDDFTAAFVGLADRHGVTLIGGDTCASRSGLTIAVTLLGEQTPSLVRTRQGARPGDLIVVSGTIGDAALGLHLLQSAATTGSTNQAARFCIDRHLRPTPRVALGQLLAAAGIHAMIDVSDGVLADLGHILAASGVGARLEAARLPLSSAYRDLTPSLAFSSPWEPALAGGEDYELLFTIPAELATTLPTLAQQAAVPLTVIGAITAEPGLRVVDAAGAPLSLPRAGYNHFA